MIAPEGRKILAVLLILTFLTGLGAYVYHLNWLFAVYAVLGFLFLACLFFFRDPELKITEGDDLILAPADGKVIQVKTVDDPTVGKEAHQVSIFLSLFNVHVNRVPVTALVRQVDYQPGKFLTAFTHAASNENEQTNILLEHQAGLVRVKQIAGFIARRILCYATAGKQMKQGERLGFIMFGSRMDVIFPRHVQVLVALGDRVRGGTTIIGKFQ